MVAAVSLWVAGCHMGVPVPGGWVAVSQSNATHAHDGKPMAASWSDHDTTGLLQVIVCYGRYFSNHTALRLVGPGRASVFWDPGGAYGEDDPAMRRRRDLIVGQALTIEQWWAYRRDGCNEPIMAVYEWRLPGDLADRLRAVLVDGMDPLEPPASFNSDAAAWTCCVSICEFLDRFTGGLVTVPKRWVLPLNLGRHLWTQGPDRVRIFRAERGETVYVKNPL